MKKKLIIILSILSVVFLIIALFFIFYISGLNKIKSNYNKYIITNKDTSLYDSNHNVIGSVSNGSYFELEDVKIKSKKDSYFKILGSDYYLYYNDVQKTDQQVFDDVKDYYIDLGKEITSNDVTNFYKNGSLSFTVNSSFSFNVISKDESFYYISFLNQVYGIKIDEVEAKDIDVSPISSYVSVINYNSVMDSCDSSDCVTTEEFKNELNYLKENGNYTISVDDFKLWLNGYINLKEKAVFITSKQDINSISNEYGFTVEQNFDDLTFVDSNSKSVQGNTSISRYNIIDKTTLDVFKKIVNGEDVVYIVEKPVLQSHFLPSEGESASRIAVLNYHFFYDPEIGETCPDGNCKKVQDFENELYFLKKNNYKTLTMDEFTKWMYGEIELPARSVLITVDDGAMGTGTHNGNKLIPLLEKYDAHATLFLISGWWSIENYRSPYLDIESHTYDMHEGNYCEGVPRGSKLLCSTREQVLEDLSKTVEIDGSKNAFCFPMYVYNDTTMDVLKEIGFKLAFVGGDVKASRSNDKYKVPRYHIYRDTSLDSFIDMVS